MNTTFLVLVSFIIKYKCHENVAISKNLFRKIENKKGGYATLIIRQEDGKRRTISNHRIYLDMPTLL